MAREELVMGLSNAMARGDSLEGAMNSFISAGYSKEEVEEASKQINMGVSQSVPSKRTPSFPPQQAPANESMQQTAELKSQQTQPLPPTPFIEPKPKRRFPRWLLISLIILGGVIVILILFMFLGQPLLDMMFGG